MKDFEEKWIVCVAVNFDKAKDFVPLLKVQALTKTNFMVLLDAMQTCTNTAEFAKVMEVDPNDWNSKLREVVRTRRQVEEELVEVNPEDCDEDKQVVEMIRELKYDFNQKQHDVLVFFKKCLEEN